MNTSASPMRDEIAEAFRRQLNDVPDSDIENVQDTEGLASRMASMVPRATNFADLVGPVYSTKALTKMWGITRAAVSKKAATGKLLALKVEGENLFPLFQFKGAEIRDDVITLVHILRAEVDPFTIAQWLLAPLEECGGRTAIELLDAGERDAAETAANRAARRWAM